MLGVRTLAVLPGPQELAEAVGDALLSRLRTLIEGTAPGRRINLAISGGAITSSLLPSLRGRVGEVDWSRVRVWFVDERYVAAGDPLLNDDEAWTGFLRHCPGVELVRMPSADQYGADGLEEAAAAFTRTWERLMGARSFDTALIGMGPDGHICSLFPHHRALDSPGPVLRVPDSPKPPPQRITVSMAVMRSCRSLWLVAPGAAKAGAIAAALGGAPVEDYPVGAVLSPTARVYLDGPSARLVR